MIPRYSHFAGLRKPVGFTLVEVLTSLVIIGILIGIFNSVFMSNWKAMEDYSTRANLWQEMDQIIDAITLDARAADTITVAGGGQTVNFFNNAGALSATYAFNAAGQCIVTHLLPLPAFAQTLSVHVDPALSLFTMVTPSLRVHIVLADNVFNRSVNIDTTTEIYPRNH